MKLADFHNMHQGETCAVIGNGPSLKNVTNESLDKFPAFGTNRIYLKYLPKYHVVVNPLVVAQFGKEISELSCIKFSTLAVEGAYGLTSMRVPLFSYNPKYVYEGHTVTFVALQLAFFMGFHKVRLIGVDHKYTYAGDPNQGNLLQGEDPNHFDPAYFKDAMWHNPDLERSAHAYSLAKKAFEDAGRIIVNCTPNSALDVFPYEAWI